MYDPVIATFQQRVRTEVDSRELSQSKTDNTRAGSCKGTSTPAHRGHADKAQCSSSTEHTSPFSKVVSENAQVKHINIISSTSYNLTNTSRNKVPPCDRAGAHSHHRKSLETRKVTDRFVSEHLFSNTGTWDLLHAIDGQ